MPQPLRGKLVAWKPDRGFGFIRPDDGSQDVFVHARDFGTIARPPRIGDVIHYQRISDGTGRVRAADVAVDGLPRDTQYAVRKRSAATRGERPARPRALPPAWRWLVVVVFAGALLACSALTPLPVIVLPLYVVASLLAWMLYAFDKAAAMNRRWRTSENTLLLVGLLGGWPGSLLAQGMFHHKSRKASFLGPFWITVILNCVALTWACSTRGAALIRGLIY